MDDATREALPEKLNSKMAELIAAATPSEIKMCSKADVSLLLWPLTLRW